MLFTACDGGPDAAHGLRLEGDDQLRKPFDLSKLVARVDRLVGRVAALEVGREVVRIADIEVDLGSVVARR